MAPVNHDCPRYDCDVLIVGAGPTGSTLAMLLAQRGVRVLLAEKEPQMYPLPRAAIIDHEALRICQAVGVAEPVMASSCAAPRYDFVNTDGEVLLRFDHADAIGPGGWPHASGIHQPSIEAVLREAVLGSDMIDTKLGWKLTAIDEQDMRVSATFETADGDVQVNARYIVGADGTRSPVRTLAGIGLDDLNFDEPWLVIDVIVDDPARLPKINMQLCDPERPTTSVVMGSGRHRWEFMIKPDETPEQVVEPDFIKGLLAKWDVEGAVTHERSAVYRFNARVAEHWRKDRILLAGDAAHQMPPFAGQGMCSGLRDAMNLGWKLAAVVEGGAPATLLDSYQAERDPHVRTIIAIAIMMGRTVCELDPEAAKARDRQMIAARAAGQELPRASQGFAAGCVLTGSEAAGDYFPQFLSDADPVERLDDVLGADAWLIARGTVDGDDGVGAFSLGDAALAPFAGAMTAWLDEHEVDAVLVRPDRYVFGTGNPATLVAAWRDRLYGGDDTAPTSPSTTKEDTMIDGTYAVVVKSPLGDQESTVTIKTDGDTFTGSNVGAMASMDIEGSVSGNTLTWQQKMKVPMPMTLDMTATIDGDDVTGTVKAGMFGTFPLTGKRTG